jgi:YD repeat-containing protein
MFWKIATRLALFLALQGLCTSIARAQIAPSQQPNPCHYRYLTANDLGYDLGSPLPRGAVLIYQNTVPGEEGLSIYGIPTGACAPPCNCPQAPGAAAGGPGGASSGGPPAGATPHGGSPINLATGNVDVVQNDLRIPGLSGGLSLSRTWNSVWPQSESSFQAGLFGPNWRSTYEERVFLASDGYVTYSKGDGSFWTFAWGSGTNYVLAAPASVDATLSWSSNYTQWTLTFQNGEQRVFNYASGWLTAIVDRNGNTTQLSYDALNRLTTVTDPGGRHIYFSYPSNTSYLVTSVTTDVGISLSYSYDSQGRLTQVTEPDLTTLNFSYDSNSNITSVTDSAGKILESHTYDSLGRGLTSSRANGVEAVSVSY